MSTKRQKGLLTYIDVPEAAGETHWVWRRRAARKALGWPGGSTLTTCGVCGRDDGAELVRIVQGDVEIPVHRRCAP